MKQRMQAMIMLALLLVMPKTQAQSLWTSADVKVGLAKGLSGHVEGEYRTADALRDTERWALSSGIDYRLCAWLKLSADYKYIHRHIESRVTKKGNIVSAYWSPRHRAFLSLTGSYSWNRFKFSVRERYQYTYRAEKTVAKWDGEDGSAKSDELVESAHDHMLRSRVKVEYNIRKSGFTPFASCEIYNSLSKFEYDKARLTVGTNYKISKRHVISAFYRFIDKNDDDDISRHIIGIGYTLKL